MFLRNMISDSIFGRKEKRWKVGDHVVQRTKWDKHPLAEGLSRYEGYPIKVNGFKCVDCEKKFKTREDFEDEKCYEVVGDSAE